MFQLHVANNVPTNVLRGTSVGECGRLLQSHEKRPQKTQRSRDSEFPTGLPPHATNRPDYGGTWHTHWHSRGNHSNQVHTRHSSVLCNWVNRHTGRSDCKGCWPHQRRHRCSLQGQGQWVLMLLISLCIYNSLKQPWYPTLWLVLCSPWQFGKWRYPGWQRSHRSPSTPWRHRQRPEASHTSRTVPL